MGLPPSEYLDIENKAQKNLSESYDFFSLVLSKWISIRGSRASYKELDFVLRSEGFNAVAGKTSRLHMNSE